MRGRKHSTLQGVSKHHVRWRIWTLTEMSNVIVFKDARSAIAVGHVASRVSVAQQALDVMVLCKPENSRSKQTRLSVVTTYRQCSGNNQKSSKELFVRTKIEMSVTQGTYTLLPLESYVHLQSPAPTPAAVTALRDRNSAETIADHLFASYFWHMHNQKRQQCSVRQTEVSLGYARARLCTTAPKL